MIINANDRQRTLSKNTKLGYISYQAESNNYLILPMLSEEGNYQPAHRTPFMRNRNNTRKSDFCDMPPEGERRVQIMDFTCRKERRNEEQHQCYVGEEQFLSGNDLQQHLCQKCYPPVMREQIVKLTQHIEDPKRRQRLQHILWKHGKLFDRRQPSIIKATVLHAIETGTHPSVYTPPYRVSYRDEQIQRDEPYEMISDDEGVRGQDEPPNEIEIISDDDIQQNTTINQHPKHEQHQYYKSLTKNQRKNRKKSAKRYRFEVIRQAYHKFTIRNIKKVLIFMNISYVNSNVVGKILFVGMKNEQIQKTVEEASHSGLFTEEHYYRIQKKLRLDEK